MTTSDYVFVLVDLALWGAIVWHGVRARAVGELWWSCVGIALIVTTKIGVIARPFNQATGGVYLDELVGHLAGVVVAALTMSWLVLVRHGSRRPYRALRLGGTGAVLAVLLLTWFLGPVYDIPADAPWIPDDVLNAPVLIAHWLVMDAFLIAFAVVFVRMAGAEARLLPPGWVRVSLRLLVAAAVLLGVSLSIGVVGRLVAAFGDRPQPDWVFTVQNVLLLGVFTLFLVAVAIPLTRRGRPGADGPASTRERVASLWTWIHDATASDGPDPAASADATLFDQVIDIRDRIWFLQRYVEPSDVARAARQARQRGYVLGTRARAQAAASCLVLAAQRHAAQAGPVTPPTANLTRLGGGRTIAQEAHWLAAVSEALAASVPGVRVQVR